MGIPSPSLHHYIDPEKQSGLTYGYPHHDYNYPEPTPGYPISNYYPPGDGHAYPIKHGTQYHPYPPAYYYDDHQDPLIQDMSSTSTSFTRLVLILMIFLISCLCMMTLVMWLLYGTYVPEFELSSIKLSNFSTGSDGSLPGTAWDATILIKNPNHDLDIDFKNVRSVILYRGNILGFSATRGFEIRRDEEFNLDFSVPAGDNKLNVDDGLIMPALDHDWSDGVAMFSLRLAMKANFSAPGRGFREESLTVSCDDLAVYSSSATEGDGRLKDGMGSPCLISLYCKC